MRRVRLRVLGVALLLGGLPAAGLGQAPKPQVGALQVEDLRERGSVRIAVLALRAASEAVVASCDNVRLALGGTESGRVLEGGARLEDCEGDGRAFSAVAFIPRKSLAGGPVDAVLEVCPGGEGCRSYLGRLPETTGPVPSYPLTWKGIDGHTGHLLFAAADFPESLPVKGQAQAMLWRPSGSVAPEIRSSSFQVKDRSFVIWTPFHCPDVDWLEAGFTTVIFEARDRQGAPQAFSFEGALPFCRSPRALGSWIGSDAAGVFVLTLVGLLLWSPSFRARLGMLWRRKSLDVIPPKWLRDEFESLGNQLSNLAETVKNLRLATVASSTASLEPEYLPEGGQGEDARPILARTPARSEVEGPEKALLQIVNDWWAEGPGSKEGLAERAREGGFKLFVSFDTDGTLQRMVGRTYAFRASNGPAGWLWHPISQNEALAVPADPFLFHAGNMIEYLRLLFDGIEEVPKSFRFYRAYRACRLKSVGNGDRYQLVEKGYLELADRTGARVEGPVPPGRPTPLAKGPARSTEKPKGASEPTSSSKEIEKLFRFALREELKDLRQLRDEPPRGTVLSPELERALRRLDVFPEVLQRLEGIQLSIGDLAGRVEQIEVLPIDAHRVEKPLAAADEGNPEPLPPVAQPALPVSGGEEDAPVEPEAARDRFAPASSWAEPASRIASEPPEEFLRRLLRGLPALADTAAPSGAGNPNPAEYLRRLAELGDRLLREQAGRGWRVDLVHLFMRQADGERLFAAHVIENVGPDYGAAKCPRCGDNLTGALLFQVFLAVRDGEGDLMGIAMVRSNLADRYPDGYALLTGKEYPRSDRGSVRMSRPAVLQRLQGGAGDLYKVVLTMDVAF